MRHTRHDRLKILYEKALLIGKCRIVASACIAAQHVKCPVYVPFEHQTLDNAAAGKKGPRQNEQLPGTESFAARRGYK